MALHLVAHLTELDYGCAEFGHLARAVGLPSPVLTTLLDQLVAGRRLLHWRLDATADELHFALAPY